MKSKVLPLSLIPSFWASESASSPALHHEGKTLSWLDLENVTNQKAKLYEEYGVKKNDFVVIGHPNSFNFFISCFSAWKVGATPMPISSKLPNIELDAILNLCQPALVDGINYDKVSAKWKYIPPNFAIDEKTSSIPLDTRIADSWKAMTSGGSTGRPKVIVSKDKAEHDIYSRDFLNFDGSVLIPGPLYHNGPFLWAMHALFQGNKVTITTRFNALETLFLIQEQNVDTVYLVPTMMHRIWKLSSEEKESVNLKSLKTIWHLASPCPLWLKHKYIDWFGPEKIWELYGGTEGIGFTIINGIEWLKHEGSVGKAGDDFEIRILDNKNQILPPREVGEVFLKRYDGVGNKYFYIGATATRTKDGWESYGDMGYLDESGYLYLTDRKTDMILSGGANIYPAEVEAAIDKHSKVRSSVVIGMPDDDLGNTVHAIIDVDKNDITTDEILLHLSKHLVQYKIPRTVEFTHTILRDEAGKVRRKDLREERIRKRSIQKT